MNEELNFEIEQIQLYLKELDSVNFSNFEEFKKERTKNLASSMCIFAILNGCIEIGERIISKKNLESPQKYREIFQILEDNNIISKKISESLQKYMHTRNMIAHQYGKINLSYLYDVVENRNIFNNFIDDILTFMKK